MSPILIRQPGDVVNEVYSENIKPIIQMCLDAGDDTSALVNEIKHELHVKETEFHSFLSIVK